MLDRPSRHERDRSQTKFPSVTLGNDSNKTPIRRIIISKEIQEITLASYTDRSNETMSMRTTLSYLCSTTGIDVDTGARQRRRTGKRGEKRSNNLESNTIIPHRNRFSCFTDVTQAISSQLLISIDDVFEFLGVGFG